MVNRHEALDYRLPPLPWLRAFEAAARHASFTTAAAELNLTQAAVSHQVRSLEKRLGVVLFERLARSLRLTEMGCAYLPPLRRAFEDITAATLGLFGPVGQCTLVVSAPVSFIALWLAPRLCTFTQAFPQIGLRISSAVWAHSAADAAVDIDIRFGDGRWPGHDAELLSNDPAIAVCRPDQVPQGSTPERLTALAPRPLIHVTGYEDLWQRLFGLQRLVAPASRSLDVDTSLAALELAAAGHGPTIVLDIFARPYLDAGRLAPALDESLSIEASHYLVTPNGTRRPRPEAILMRAWLHEQAKPRANPSLTAPRTRRPS